MPVISVAGIESLDDIFIKHWGEKTEHLYYFIEFSNLKRENRESISNFTKRFNNMYNKIPIDTSAMITYAMPLTLISTYFLEKGGLPPYHSCKILP